MKRPELALLILVLMLSSLVISPLAAQASEARCAAVAVSGTDTAAGVTVVAMSADSNACALDGHKRAITRVREIVHAAQAVAGAVGAAAATITHVMVRAALRVAASAVAAIV